MGRPQKRGEDFERLVIEAEQRSEMDSYDNAIQYRLQIGAWNLTLSEDLYNNLRDAISAHETEGFRDGETRLGRVVIVECAVEKKS